MKAVISDMLGGFVNGCISAKVFEKHLYAHMNEYQRELDKNTFDMLVFADYGDESDIGHLKRFMCDAFPASLYNDGYFRSTNKADIAEAYRLSHPDMSQLVIDLSDIDTTDELHTLLKRTLSLPDTYGRNWASLEDMIDLSACRSITINGYGSFYQKNVKDALIFVWLISKNKSGDCLLTVNN
ncbi:barstar family protein [Ruminococcus sp. NK3A76]|uniref:barstar family protein n=1 Tax=Ruminococcus sp. NK3A76 TaxID=877411 RepID=UPI000561AC91|nr:barstar family protein [Ruminococcus sp. NK3A76]